MIKNCIICGSAFRASPSSKKITCSPDCSKRRKIETHTGVRNAWSDDARKKLSKQYKAKGFNDNARHGLSVAMSLPESQRGPKNRNSKIWLLIAPDGERYKITNLMDWARRHAHWFDVVSDDADRDHIARNIRAGFGGIVQSMLGHKKHPCYTYKGWTLGDWPKDREGNP